MSYYIVSIIARSSSSDTCNNYKKKISTQCAACDKFCVFFQNEHIVIEKPLLHTTYTIISSRTNTIISYYYSYVYKLALSDSNMTFSGVLKGGGGGKAVGPLEFAMYLQTRSRPKKV